MTNSKRLSKKRLTVLWWLHALSLLVIAFSAGWEHRPWWLQWLNFGAIIAIIETYQELHSSVQKEG